MLYTRTDAIARCTRQKFINTANSDLIKHEHAWHIALLVHAGYAPAPAAAYAPAPAYGYAPAPSYNPDEVRTVFVTGFPADVKERELNNLLRFVHG